MGVWRSVRSLFTRGKSAADNRVNPGSALPDLSVWQSFQRIGGSLTPQEVSSILRVADTGDVRFLCDLADEMRQKDGHLQSCLFTRECALASLKWELFYPGQDPKSKKGGRQRKFVEEALRNAKGFRRMLAHQSSAAYYGRAISETVWDVVDGKLVPKHFVNHAPRRFRYRREDGLLVWWDDNMGVGVDFRTDFPDKFLVSQPRINGGVQCREGLTRVLMWPALFRNWTLGDWLKLAEIAWKPWRLGRFKKNASQEDIAKLQQILSSMSASGFAAFPETIEVELRWPDGAGGSTGRSDHSGLFDVMGREISKATLGQTLTTEQGKVGSQALGNVHNEVRLDILEFDATWLAETVNEDLVEPLVRMNFGPSAVVPQFRFITQEGTDLVQLATALNLLTGPNVRMRVPAQWARDTAGIPDPKADEEILGQTWVEVDTSGLDDPTPPANDGAPDPKTEPATKDKKAA